VLRLLLLLLLALPASAQIWGNDVSTVAPGRFRLTYIYVGTDGQLRFDDSGRARLSIANKSDTHQLRFTFGVLDNLDIHLQSGEGFVSRDDGSRANYAWGNGPDDSQLRVRWRFYEDEVVKMGLLSTTTVPTGSLGDDERLSIGQGFMSQTEDLIIRLDLDRFQLWNEAFFVFPLDKHQSASTAWGYNFCLGYTIGDLVQPTIEFSYSEVNPGNVKQMAITPGISFMPGDFIIQVAVQKVIAGTNTDIVIKPILFFHYNF
jgi:hypothetical protein